MPGVETKEPLKPSAQPAKTVQAKTIAPTNTPKPPSTSVVSKLQPRKSIADVYVEVKKKMSVSEKKFKNDVTDVGDGLQHHFISGNDFVSTHKSKTTTAANKEAFQEKYVDVVDTDDLHLENDPRVVAYKEIMVHIERIHMIYIGIMGVLAAICAVCSYTFIQIEHTYAYMALEIVLLQTPTHILIVIGVIVLIPFYGLYIISYPKPKFNCFRFGRWIIFFIIEGYLAYCLGFYILSLSESGDFIKKNMLKDIQVSPFDKSGRLKYVTTIRELTQHYYRCCGYESYQDWTQNNNSLLKNSLDQGGLPIGCCNKNALKDSGKNPCFAPLLQFMADDNGMNNKSLIYEDGCGKHEVKMATTIISVLAGFLSIIILAMVPLTIYLAFVIHGTNYHDFNLVTPPGYLGPL